MSVPGNINSAPPPSSFDDDESFYEESRWNKIKRKLIEEPLIPLGCALTVWALIEATKSIRSGDKHRTNRMFRRRIYAQGFTLLAMVGGSAYWEGDRRKRKEYDALVEEKRKKEKQENWIRELEARDAEERELRAARDNAIRTRVSERQKKTADDGKPPNVSSSVRSALEASEVRGGSILAAVQSLWQNRK